MCKIRLFVLLVFLPALLFSKEKFTLSGWAKNSEKFPKAYLYKYYKSKSILLDSTKNQKGHFKFELTKNDTRGIYKVRFSPFKLIDNIIFNFENIEFNVDLNDIQQTLSYTHSNENKIYRYYRKFTNNELNREKAIVYLLGFYSKSDKFYNSINAEMQRLKETNQNIIQALIEENKEFLAAKIIKYDQLPQFSRTGNYSEDILILREVYWGNVDLSDTTLLYINYFNDKIDKYLMLFEDAKLTLELQEDIFIDAIKKLLLINNINSQVKDYIIKKLLDDSYDYNLPKLYAFLATKIIKSEDCLNTNEKSLLRKNLFILEKLNLGAKAADIKISKTMNLYDIQSEYILLLFWDPDCEECLNEINSLKRLYLEIDDKNRFEILAVAITDNSEKFKQIVIEKELNWINISEMKGWNSLILMDYPINSTPHMLLLDNIKTIISKPIKSEHIEKYIKEKADSN